jgi:hypothetical protein
LRQTDLFTPASDKFDARLCAGLAPEIRVLTTTASYRLLASDMTRSLDRAASAPTVKRASEYYLAHIKDIKSIDDFLANDRIFSYAMKAFGLDDMTYAKAFMRKALEGGIDDKESFANKLADTRYRDFVETFNFARYGETATVFDRTAQGTVDKYVQQTMEEDAGAQNEGVRLALYFRRKAEGIESVYDILADPALLKVAQTALGIPAETGAIDIDRQAALMTAKLDIEDLKDPEKLDELLTRFTSLYELQRDTTVTSPSLMLISGPVEAGIGANLLLTLQNLKLGGS